MLQYVRSDLAAYAVLFVRFTILGIEKHVHTIFPALHLLNLHLGSTDDCENLCALCSMDPETKAAHTEKAQHSIGLPLTSLWDSLRSRPLDVGPGCMRVPTKLSVSVCVSL